MTAPLTMSQFSAAIAGDTQVVGGDYLTGYNDLIHQPFHSYSEAAYFDGFHFAHIGAWEEHNRLLNKQRQTLLFLRR